MMAQWCEEVSPPVNIIALPGVSEYANLAQIGVARISYGPVLYRKRIAWFEVKDLCDRQEPIGTHAPVGSRVRTLLSKRNCFLNKSLQFVVIYNEYTLGVFRAGGHILPDRCLLLLVAPTFCRASGRKTDTHFYW